MTSNAARRRQERDRRRRQPIIIGDGVVATEIGERYDASTVAFAQLPAKRPGQHRFIAIASFVLNTPQSLIGREDTMKVLGPRTLHSLSIGCYDCEQVYSDDLGPRCPAEAAP